MTEAAEQLRESDSVILMELADAVRMMNDDMDKAETDFVDVSATFTTVTAYTSLAKLTGAAQRNEAEYESALAGDRAPAFEMVL